MTSFASDNTAGAHPAVLDALAAASAGHAPAYGADRWSAAAADAAMKRFMIHLFSATTSWPITSLGTRTDR